MVRFVFCWVCFTWIAMNHHVHRAFGKLCALPSPLFQARIDFAHKKTTSHMTRHESIQQSLWLTERKKRFTIALNHYQQFEQKQEKLFNAQCNLLLSKVNNYTKMQVLQTWTKKTTNANKTTICASGRWVMTEKQHLIRRIWTLLTKGLLLWRCSDVSFVCFCRLFK